jgi:hypothetical protein
MIAAQIHIILFILVIPLWDIFFLAPVFFYTIKYSSKNLLSKNYAISGYRVDGRNTSHKRTKSVRYGNRKCSPANKEKNWKNLIS